jgi:tetratricopeptide (TPR) repeat protein
MKKLIYVWCGLFLLAVVNFASAQTGSMLFNLKSAEQKAHILYEQGNFASALPLLKEVYQEQKNNNQLKLKLAYSYFQVDDARQATRYFTDIAEDDSLMQIEYILAYAHCLQKLGQNDKAKTQFERLAARTGQTLELPDDLGRTQLLRYAARYSVQNITLNTKHNEFSPLMLGSEMYFISDREKSSLTSETVNRHTTNLDVYVAGSHSQVRFAYPEPVKKINSGWHEGALSADTAGTIYFSRLEANGRYQLYQFGIAEENVPKTAAKVKLPFKGNIFHPAISADGNTLIFSSDQEGGLGGLDLYYTTRTSGDGWSEPRNLGASANTAGNEVFPSFFEQKVYFASDGRVGLGGLDIYQSYLSGGKLVAIENLGAPVNSEADDFSLIGDKEGGYFASNRSGGRGGDDLYRLDLQVISLVGRVVDSTNYKPVENAQVTLTGPSGKQSAITNKYGEYSFKLFPGEQYTLDFETETDYKPRQVHYSTFTGKTYGPRNVSTALERKTKLFVLGKVRYANRKRASEPEIILVDRTAGGLDTLQATKRGNFEAELDRESNYAFIAKCNNEAGLAFFQTPEQYDASLSYYINVSLQPFTSYRVYGKVINTSGADPVSVWVENSVTGQKQLLFAENGNFSFDANSLCGYQLCVEQGSSYAAALLNEGWIEGNREISISLKATDTPEVASSK